MTPAVKRTILTSKTGRRYFFVRSANRPHGRRYFVCSITSCTTRVAREADLFCRAHTHQDQLEGTTVTDSTIKSENVDENDMNNDDSIMEEVATDGDELDTPIKDQELIQQNENGNNDVGSIMEEDFDDGSGSGHAPTQASMPLSPHPQSNRHVDVDEMSGARIYRDSSGRRRYVCMHVPCTNMLKRQSDVFCRVHMDGATDASSSTKRRNHTRYSAPPLSQVPPKDRFRSPFSTTNVETTPTMDNGNNGNHSDEYATPKKAPQRSGTTRTFRDASGKLRFLCSNTSCHSRVPRQSELFCRRHQLEALARSHENNIESLTTNVGEMLRKDDNAEETNSKLSSNASSSRRTTSDSASIRDAKKRKRESSTTNSSPKNGIKSFNLSSIPSNKMVLATTTLLDNQWADLQLFIRQFSDVQLSTNLNVNNVTTHLLVDDSDNPLHCTITKKIVQAAVRRHLIILSSRWLTECLHQNQYLDEHPFEILSDSHTTLRLSKENNYLTKPNETLFPSGQSLYAFAIECRQCQGSINRLELIELVELTGASLFRNEQAVETLLVLCDANDKNLNKIKEKYVHAPASNIKFVTSDFLLKSIIKFEIQDIDKYAV